MRIVVVSDLPHFVTGGAEMQAMRLIEAWLDAGHEVRCFGRRMGARSVEIGQHRIEVRPIRTTSLFGRAGRAVSYFLSLAWLLLQHRGWVDLLYTRFLGEAAATAAVLKQAGLLDVPLVATPANTRGNGDTNLLRSLPLGGKLIAMLDRQCDAINLIAADMVDELRAAGFDGANFTRIPNGVVLRPVPLRERDGVPHFIAVGRFTPQKGYDLLIEALGRLRDRLSPMQVWIVGDGPERERLHALARTHGVEANIAWHGELPQRDVAQLLDRAHAFLLPSRYEGLSNAGLEAMERGLALVVSRCGGLDHYVDASAGWVVPVEDVDALVDALSAALDAGPAQLANMGASARVIAERNFDMEVVGARYLALFESLRAARSAAKAQA